MTISIRHYIICQIAFACLILCGCGFFARGNVQADHVKGIVMSEGMTISINNPDCFPLSITAKEGLLREYTWNGGTRSAILLPRTRKWAGHYGAGSSGWSTDNAWEMHDGVNRHAAEEAILDFVSRDHLLCALAPSGDECRDKYFGKPIKTNEDIKKHDSVNTFPNNLRSWSCSAYTDDGYYVSYGKSPGPLNGDTLYITLYKFLINSQTVSNLPGSKNERVIVTYPSNNSDLMAR